MIKNSLENILKTSFIAGSINFLATVYFIANVDKIDYGSYLIIFGIFAFAPRILQGIDDLVVRFNHEIKKKNANFFFCFSVTLKLSLSILIVTIIVIIFKKFFLNVEVNFSNKYKTLFIIIIFAQCILSSLRQILFNFVLSKLKYKKIYKINFIVSIVGFFGTLLIVKNFQSSIIFYIALQLITNVIQIIYFLNDLSKKVLDIEIKNWNLKFIYFYYKNYIKKYALPISASHGVSYFQKDHGPNAIIGSFFGPEIISIIAISKLFYEFIHNFLSNVLRKLYPVYFFFNNKKLLKKSIFRKIFYLGNFAYLVVGIIFLIFYEIYFNKMGLDTNQINFIVFLIISYEFAFKFTASYLGIGLPISKNTKGIFYANIVKTIASLIIVFLGVYFEKYIICILGLTFGHIMIVPLLLKYCPKNIKLPEMKIAFFINISLYGILVYKLIPYL